VSRWSSALRTRVYGERPSPEAPPLEHLLYIRRTLVRLLLMYVVIYAVAGLLIATVPLIAVVLYRVVSPTTERITRRRFLGLIIGFAGVAALVGIDLRGTDLVAVAEIAVPAVGYSIGPLIISRRLSGLPSLGVVSASVALTAIVYAPVALTHLPRHVSFEVVAAVAGLAFVCTALAFLVFFALIAEVKRLRIELRGIGLDLRLVDFMRAADEALADAQIVKRQFSRGVGRGHVSLLVPARLAQAGAGGHSGKACPASL